MQYRKLVSEPGNGKTLTTACAVMNQVALARAMLVSMSEQAAHCIDLVIAWKYQTLLARLAPLIILFFYDVQVLLDEIEQAILRPKLLPEICGWETFPGRRAGCAPIAAFV